MSYGRVGVQLYPLFNVLLDEHVFRFTPGHFTPGKGSPVPTRWKAGVGGVGVAVLVFGDRVDE